MTKETNQIRMFGVLPSQDADPIKVRMAPEAAGGDMIETNKIRMMGILPSQDADPILVEVTNFDAKARAVHSPFSIPPAAINPCNHDTDFTRGLYDLRLVTALTAKAFLAPVILPPGVTVTKLTCYGYRDDASADLLFRLHRSNRFGAHIEMAAVDADWTSGYSSKFDAIINNPIIDNANYDYHLYVHLDPNDNVLDVRFSGAKIEFTG